MLNRFQPDDFFPYNICLTSADKLELKTNTDGSEIEQREILVFEVTGDALGCHPLPHFCNVERGYGWCYL